MNSEKQYAINFKTLHETHFMLRLLSQVLSSRALVKVWHKLLGKAHSKSMKDWWN